MYAACDDDVFNLERHLVPFLQENAFFTEVSRHIRKVVTLDKRCPTAALVYDTKNEEFTMYVNADFFNSLSDLEVKGVLRHELYHFINGHLTFRRKRPPRRWNIATDLAINSIIVKNTPMPKVPDSRGLKQRVLPECGLVPGRWPVHPTGRELTKEEKAASELGALIASFPHEESSEWYFNKISELADSIRKKRKLPEAGDDFVFGEDTGDDWIDSMDDHSMWDDVPEQVRDLLEGKVREILSRAATYADGRPDGWGDVPEYMRKEIRTYLAGELDWRPILKNWVGSICSSGRRTSLKRINRRYPYSHPGVIKNRVPKLLIAMDQSGSVMDDWVSQFFGELNSLNKKVDISVLPFDADAQEKDIVEWRKGMPPPAKRTKCGGTIFDAPTRIFNDPKNRGRWDGFMIMTDGGGTKPQECRGKRAWILPKGCTLMFDTEEMQVFLSNPPTPGVIR